MSLTLFGQLPWHGSHCTGSLVAPLPGVPGDAPPHLSPVFETLRSEAPHRHPHIESCLTSYNRKHRLRDDVQLGQDAARKQRSPP